MKVYALVIVCLLSGACNILAMEERETQDVVASIERHSARYGVPRLIYIDNGIQLKALKHSSMSSRNVVCVSDSDYEGNPESGFSLTVRPGA